MDTNQSLEQHCASCNIYVKVYPSRPNGYVNWERHQAGEKHQRKLVKARLCLSSDGQTGPGNLPVSQSGPSETAMVVHLPPKETIAVLQQPADNSTHANEDSCGVNSAALPQLEQVLRDNISKLPIGDINRTPPCLGAHYTLSDKGNIYLDYPWALHANLALDWLPEIINERLYLRSLHSMRVAKLWSSPICDQCARLLTHPMVIAIKERALSECSEKINRSYLTISQLHDVVENRVAQVKALKLNSLNQGRALASRTTVLNDFNRFLMAVSSGKVERINTLVSVALRNGVGLSGILDRIDRAMNLSYSPRSYTSLDHEKGVLALRLGESQLLNLLHRTAGFPHTRTIQRHTFIPHLRASAGVPSGSEMRYNLQATSFSGLAKRTGATLMFDEIALKKALRLDVHSNQVLGLCREHTSKHCSVEFAAYEDAEAIHKALCAGKVHLASEVSG